MTRNELQLISQLYNKAFEDLQAAEKAAGYMSEQACRARAYWAALNDVIELLGKGEQIDEQAN